VTNPASNLLVIEFQSVSETMGRNWNFFSFDLRDRLSREFPLGGSRLAFWSWDDKRERRRCFSFANLLSFHPTNKIV
jgi:hypothetical protein